MHYILLTQLESHSPTSSTIKGLRTAELENVTCILDSLSAPNNTHDDILEVDRRGVEILNILAGAPLNYRICGQSMAMEKSIIGGRTIQIQTIVWSLGSEK